MTIVIRAFLSRAQSEHQAGSHPVGALRLGCAFDGDRHMNDVAETEGCNQR
ncbi:hypothetical protein [Novosphingobium capsulatum]|uniref:hypothetical protein n=1 Tax=Novosphingobium capsulatum TaxID=13688 RepID=UPI0012EE5E9C|nr:hypothetical protein [Novosphingobium capsulatum]